MANKNKTNEEAFAFASAIASDLSSKSDKHEIFISEFKRHDIRALNGTFTPFFAVVLMCWQCQDETFIAFVSHPDGSFKLLP